MIATLQGTLLRKRLPAVVIEAGGVGYEVHVPLGTFEALPPEGSPAFLEIFTLFRPEALQLFGFCTPGERAVFGLLLGVTGIGPRLALALLSNLPGPEILRAVAEGQPRTLQSVPGIGRKMAERLVLELKDKVGQFPQILAAASPGPADRGGLKADALAALENLGYRRTDAEAALDQAFRQEGPLNLAQVLRLALKQLGTRG